MIGERIKEERERLGFTQPDFAALAGAAKRTLIEWEKGNTSPNAVQLSALSEAGVDALYVLTGNKAVTENISPPTIRRDQAALLDNIEHCSKEVQDAIKRLAFVSAKADKDKTQSGKKSA